MKDVFKMRLKIAQNYVKSLKEGITQSSGGVSVKLHAQVFFLFDSIFRSKE
jgi:hypothetical protein